MSRHFIQLCCFFFLILQCFSPKQKKNEELPHSFFGDFNKKLPTISNIHSCLPAHPASVPFDRMDTRENQMPDNPEVPVWCKHCESESRPPDPQL